MHGYFADGSNLCVDQMAQRCPGARDPIQAMLANHDWLINERGVATVAPLAGNAVHGVLWRLDDQDLAVLDRAEGVPVYYRRERLLVKTATGSAPAWVYIDHRAEPGPPRPGYLEQVIDGALHHGLPNRWVDFLRRWDRPHWPARRTTHAGEGPQSLSELLRVPHVTESSVLRSRFGFLAIHGGGLEKVTDVIAERAAEQAGASVYTVHHPDGYPHHLPSARYLASESSRLAEFLSHVDVVISLHGYGRIGRSTHLLAGGGNRALAEHVARCVTLPGYRLLTDLHEIPPELRGVHPDNPVNRSRGGGVQLELPARVRGISPRSRPAGPNDLSPATSALVDGLTAAAAGWGG